MDRLVVTFEHAASVNKSDAYRHGWGSVFFRKKRISHICIKAKANHWYQQPGLEQALSKLRDDGLFDKFKHRLTYGGSMGGFAAIAYADLVDATTVLALNPQSTLRRRSVPWERRFPEARAQNWNGPFSDAKGLAKLPKKIIAIYDPHVRGDFRQVKRLDQASLIRVQAPFIGHGLTRPLTSMNMLTPILMEATQDRFDLGAFHQDLRKRREIPRYYEILERRRRVLASPTFTRIVAKAKSDFLERSSR
ncbi:MAG: hypothetical protein ABJM43_22115 [Paracoccaceae bacterium]|uniref:hypothetical protein n=1 Tax=Ascidiaceihabitans sp. TaxID=1872644 RepID=UPI00329929CE